MEKWQIVGDIIKPTTTSTKANIILNEAEISQRIYEILSQVSNPDGWMPLAQLGAKLKIIPLFNPHHYGCENLILLLRKLQAFETKRESNNTVYVRNKSSR